MHYVHCTMYLVHSHPKTYQALKAYEEHLHKATVERSLYRSVCDESRRVYQQHLGTHGPLPESAVVHYSFDFAQQVHYPSDPLQPGPVYFLTPRKCALFGVCSEAVPRQVS